MATFERSIDLTCPVERVFDFLIQPANLLHVSPPELHMKLVDGPTRLRLGARVILQGKRWGIPQRIVSEITAFEVDRLFVDEQREGPFRKWAHHHLVDALGGGTRLTDRVEYEAPGGLVGLVMTVERIRKDLEWIFDFRTKKLRELLEDAGESLGDELRLSGMAACLNAGGARPSAASAA